MFFVFEGIDGAGKSTQARLLKSHIEARYGRMVAMVREPGGTPVGERIREILLDPASGELSAEVELFLFMAARAHLCQTSIRPGLARGDVVISDRFSWSSVVYQGIVGGLTSDEVFRVARLATGGLEPDRTFVIDVPPARAFERLGAHDRVERKGVAFQEKVREGFLSLAGEHPGSARVIDGSGAPEEVSARVVAALPSSGW